jgi:diguanylate cyclase (GGDEF)-like protein
MATLDHSTALRDELTGLASRSTFLRALDAALEAGFPFAVVFLDLDHFKRINDTLGHGAGDDLLRQVATRVAGVLRPADLVARLGGDELAILVSGADTGAAARLAERVRDAIVPAFRLGDHERHVSASVGWRCWPACDGDDADAEALLRDADAAMYQAKDGGRNRVAAYSDELRRALVERVELEHALRDALAADALTLHYQPIVDLGSGIATGVEALLRWPGGPPPGEFIPVAEETGLIVEIGRWVVRHACAQLAEWERDHSVRDLTMTVNVSPLQLQDPRFPQQVATAARDAGIDPARICLEFTESAVLEPEADTNAGLQMLKDLGIFLAIDDFGVERSSLSRLKRVPVEVLKVDRSFIDGLGTDPDDSAIVASILSLAHAMGLHVVAEGVETRAQADELLALGCNTGQGWLFARAMAPDEVVAHIAATRGAAGRPRRLAPLARAKAPVTARTRGHSSLVVEMMHIIGIEVGDR